MITEIKEIEKSRLDDNRQLICYLLTNSKGNSRLVYIYDCGGRYFKVFMSVGRLIDYLSKEYLAYYEREFYDEQEIPIFLSSIEFDDMKITNYKLD